MTSKAISAANLQQEAIVTAHELELPFPSICDLSGFLQHRDVPRPERSDKRRPSSSDRVDLTSDEIFLYRGHDRLSPFKLEQCDEENSISREVASRLKLDTTIDSEHRIYWYRSTEMKVQRTTFRVREIGHQVLLGRNFNDCDRFSHTRCLSTSSDESAGTRALDPSSSQDDVVPVSCPRKRSPDYGEDTPPNPIHHEPRHDPHGVSSQGDPDVSSEVTSTDDAECRESLEATPQVATEDWVPSSGLIQHPMYGNPAPEPVGQAGFILPRSRPYRISNVRPAIKSNWSVAPTNKPIGEPSNWLSHPRYSEESDSGAYSDYEDYNPAVWQTQLEVMPRDSRSRRLRTPSTSTHGSSRSRGNRRDGRREGRAYADSFDSDDSHYRREGYERPGHRRRVSDQVAHYAAAFVVGALLVARAAR